MAMLVVAAASGPSVVMSASPVHVSVTVAAPMLDFDRSAIRRGHRGHAQPGGSGYGHGQRSKQRSSNQNETSHLVLSRRVIAIRHKFPTNGFVPPGPKLNPPCNIRALIAIYSRLRCRRSPRRRQRDPESVRCMARVGVGDATWRLRPSLVYRFAPAA
jgi:hypothetical protein